MDKKYKRHQNLFEAWVKAQFKDRALDLTEREDGDGYVDDTINTLWVGFCAGFEIALA